MTKKAIRLSKYQASALQGRFDLAVRKQRPALALEFPFETIALRALIASIALLACAYLYFVSVSVFNVMAQREASAQSDRIESSIADLEGRYFSLAQAVTPESASSLGLAPIKNQEYVRRSAGTEALSSPVSNQAI